MIRAFRWVVSGLLLWVGQSAHAQTAPSVETLEQSLVRVIVRTAEGGSTGTGFIVSNNGHIITNHHVVEGATRVEIALSNIPKGIPAQILWSDERFDLAILRAEIAGRPPVSIYFKDENFGTKGQVVQALGYPGIADLTRALSVSATYSKGNIANIQTVQFKADAPKIVVLQHTAVIAGGNSGGPLFDECGRVVGVNTFTTKDDRAGGQIGAASASYVFAVALESFEIEHRRVSTPCTLTSSAGSQSTASSSSSSDDPRARAEAREAAQTARAAQQESRALQQSMAAERAEFEARSRAFETNLAAARQEAAQAKEAAEDAVEASQAASERARRAERESERIQEENERISEQTDRLQGILIIAAPVFGILLIAAIVLALRRPRQQIVQVVRDSVSRVSRLGQSARQGALGGVPLTPIQGSRYGGATVGVGGYQNATEALDGGGVLMSIKSGEAVGASASFSAKDLAAGVEIGRESSGRNFVVKDKSVSRRHAIIMVKHGAFFVTDLNSTNGTFVDGVRVTGSAPTLLPPNGVLRVGSAEVNVRSR